jgi:hypothetical protein
MTIPPHILTYLAEDAGSNPHLRAVKWLKALLSHPSPVVREGAVIGLSKSSRPEARKALEQHKDESPGVRAVLADLLRKP